MHYDMNYDINYDMNYVMKWHELCHEMTWIMPWNDMKYHVITYEMKSDEIRWSHITSKRMCKTQTKKSNVKKLPLKLKYSKSNKIKFKTIPIKWIYE